VDFPIPVLLDEQACYDFLVDALRPQDPRCPGCRGSRYAAHRSRRDPVLDYRYAACGGVFNAWTGALLQDGVVARDTRTSSATRSLTPSWTSA
jgi:hypothetical protein